jgi:iron complex outermembrane receptor protein
VAAQGIGFTPATAASPFNAPGLVNYIANNKPTKASQADWAPRRPAASTSARAWASAVRSARTTLPRRQAAVVWDLSDSVRMVSLTSYNELTRDAVFDWSGAPYEILIQKAHGDIESTAEELHFEGSTDKGSWLVGGYVAHDEILDMQPHPAGPERQCRH